MCGSTRAYIEWDAERRLWFCTLRTDAPRRSAGARSAATRETVAPREAPLPALRCDRCQSVLLEGAAAGVSAYCGRCRRWSVQPEAVAGGESA
jgi:hypothetical protein